jgi:CubicO group peptidase (beta-lactamase class C family)
MLKKMIPTNPEEVGFSFDRLRKLDKLFQDYVDQGKLAGIVATVARLGTTVYLGKAGCMDRETNTPIRFDSIFRIASMTKPITALAAMLLYEEGHFHFNTPIKEFIPEFTDTAVVENWNGDEPILVKRNGEITLRHLFTHTSGLSSGGNPQDPLDRLYQKKKDEIEVEGIPQTNQNIIPRIASIPLKFQPGTKWHYGFNIEVLGRIIEIISGEALDAFMAKRIFQPLGMLDTAFFVPPEKLNRFCTLYGHPEDSRELVRLDWSYPTVAPAFLNAGGGLYSTLPDYARFTQLMVNDGELDEIRLISPRTATMFRMNHAPLEIFPYRFNELDTSGFGYGFGLGMKVLMDVSASGQYGSIGEYGWDGAFNTYFWIDPIEKLYGILMTQHHPNAYYPISRQFKAITYSALVDPVKTIKKAKKKK